MKILLSFILMAVANVSWSQADDPCVGGSATGAIIADNVVKDGLTTAPETQSAALPDECFEALAPSLTVSQVFGAVILHWSHYSGNAYGYEIYRDNVAVAQAVNAETHFIDGLAEDGNTYSYYVFPLVREDSLTGATFPRADVQVKVSAWSNVDPADALRFADPDSREAELDTVSADRREVVIRALLGDEADDFLETAGLSSVDDDSDVADEKGIAISVIDNIVNARDNSSRRQATDILNNYLYRSGIERGLLNRFTARDFDTEANVQDQLTLQTFDEVRTLLSELDIDSFDSDTAAEMVGDTVVQVLNAALVNGLESTKTENWPDDIELTGEVSGSELLAPIDKQNVANSEAGIPAAANTATMVLIENNSIDANTKVVAPTSSTERQKIGAAETDNASDSDANGGTSTMLLIERSPSGISILDTSSSSSADTLDLSVEPGQGFETLSLDQPVPIGGDNQLDLNTRLKSNQ